jgi:hypothetical protein
MSRLTAKIKINDAPKKALGFVSKFKSEGAGHM